MFARFIANHKWMAAAAAVAILALVLGVLVVLGTLFGRSIIPAKDEAQRHGTAPPKQTSFTDKASGLTLRYPAAWARLSSRDPQVHLVAAASPETSMSLRVAKSALADVSLRTLPVVRPFSDELLAADRRTRMLSEPEPVSLAGIAGYRYRYTYTTSAGKTGAHVHFFLFKHGQLVQLVFQSVPATGLAAAEPTYNAIAASLARAPR